MCEILFGLGFGGVEWELLGDVSLVGRRGRVEETRQQATDADRRGC